MSEMNRLDYQAETREILGLLSPAIADTRNIEKARENLNGYFIKYQSIAPDTIRKMMFDMIDLHLRKASKQRDFDMQKAENELKIAMKSYDKIINEPVKGLGFSIIAGDFLDIAAYLAVDAFNARRQEVQKTTRAVKALTSALDKIRTDYTMYDDDSYNLIISVGNAMQAIDLYLNAVSFYAEHTNISDAICKNKNLSNEIKEILVNASHNNYTGTENGNSTILIAMENSGYVKLFSTFRVATYSNRIITQKSYISTLVAEKDSLQELYFQEHPEERRIIEESKNQEKENQYLQAESYLSEGKYFEAAKTFSTAAGYKDAIERSVSIWHKYLQKESYLFSDTYGVCALKEDGSMLYNVDVNNGSYYQEEWNFLHTLQDVRQFVSGSTNVALLNDGTVRCQRENYYTTSDPVKHPFVSGAGKGWKNVIRLYNDYSHLFALHANGKVSAVGSNNEKQCITRDWENIVKVAVGFDITVGLTREGRVFATPSSKYDLGDISRWENITDIIAVSAGVFGLHADGTLSIAPLKDKEDCLKPVYEWNNIVRIRSLNYGFAGLTKDGKIVSCGALRDYADFLSVQEKAVDIWHSPAGIVVLHTDGTLSSFNYRCNISEWKDIVEMIPAHDWALGVRANGEVVFTSLESNSKYDPKAAWRIFDNINTVYTQKLQRIQTKRTQRLNELQQQLASLKGLFIKHKREELEKQITDIQQLIKAET